MAKSKGFSSRERLQSAAKSLFAERGYEITTVAAIVKLAKTSYSQFIAHFGDKRGVMAAILSEGWTQINSAIRLATSKTSVPMGKLKTAVDVLISYLERDQAFRKLLLTETVTARENETLSPEAGFSDFVKILDEIFAEMVRGGELSPQMHPQVLRSGLVGALQGMLRDQLLGEHGEAHVSFPESAIRMVFANFLSSALTSSQPVEISAPDVAVSTLPGWEETPLDKQIDQRWIHHYLDLAAIALGPHGNA